MAEESRIDVEGSESEIERDLLADVDESSLLPGGDFEEEEEEATNDSRSLARRKGRAW